MTDSEVVMSFTGLSKTVGRHHETEALRAASGEIRRGEFVAIVGASGSGKTTLLSILGLLDQPTGGKYVVGGVDISSLSEAQLNRFRGRRFGFVFQNSYLVAEDSVGGNVAMGLKVRGVAPGRRRALVTRALEQVGLADAVEKRAGDCSGGEKQRIAVARAVVMAPDVILADEPTGALDSASTEQLIALIRQINHNGTTIIVVTHDPLVAAAADRQIAIDDGVTLDDDGVRRETSTVSEWVPRKSLPPEGMASRRVFHEMADAVLTPLNRPARSLLVVLAYVLGVAGLVGAMGVMASTTGQIVTRLTEAGSSQVRVVDTSSVSQPWDVSSGWADQLSHVEGVVTAVPVRTFTVVGNTVTRINGLGEKYAGHLVVTDERYLEAQHVASASGRIDLLGNPWRGPVVVAGSAAAAALGLPDAGPGVSLVVNGRSVDVGAILLPSGDQITDDSLYFSPGVMPYLTDQLEDYAIVYCEPGYSEPLSKAIPLVLMPADPGRISVSVVAQLAQLQQGINSDLGQLLGTIGWVILALSALTAGTTMFLSVQHRSAEIALRRAMGMSRASVWRMFTYEGIVIGGAGGVIGSAAGVTIAWVVARASQWPLCLGVAAPLMGVGVGFVAGMVAAIVPAVYAANQQPAQILRTA